ncbi:hypothetical protein [Deinococcus sp. QL22]|uniref:hypothetical protein n=1 Tax=Deinococcus sp. QL22 TaxID=2939437 RepID=UPI002016C4D9|nr:hypothetical protein [Deinococcus sp. QL22]UQN09809.1 hypothetical protein M1R55_25425 [Deinococcus sp. QL22]
MNLLLQVLMGGAGALSVVTLLLLFTGDLQAMTVSVLIALLLAAVAMAPLVYQEAQKQASAGDR